MTVTHCLIKLSICVKFRENNRGLKSYSKDMKCDGTMETQRERMDAIITNVPTLLATENKL